MNFKFLEKLLLEKNKKSSLIFINSDEPRKDRSENVKIISLDRYTPSNAPKDKPLARGWILYEYKVLSAEKTENREHTGYLALDRNKSIKDIYCSCADFQFLWRYSLVKDDMASWETYPEYKDIETHGPHTKDPSNITNPLFNKKLCKHLLKVYREIYKS